MSGSLIILQPGDRRTYTTRVGILSGSEVTRLRESAAGRGGSPSAT